MLKLKNSAMLVVAALCGYLALMTPDWKGQLVAAGSQAYVSDFNADGTDDLLLRNVTTSENVAWVMANHLRTSTSVLTTNTATFEVVALIDANNDLDEDILWYDSVATDMIFWRMQGGVKEGNNFLGKTFGATLDGTGDFDGDGDTDILLKTAAGDVKIWTIQNMARVLSTNIGTPGGTYQVIDTGDFNGDGIDDIVMQNAAGAVRVWQLDANAALDVTIDVATISTAYDLKKSGDTDNDGDDDLIFRNDTTGQSLVWEMENGARVVQNVFSALNPQMNLSLVVDFDQDGDEDMLFRDIDPIGSPASNGQSIIWEMQDNLKASNSFLGSSAVEYILMAAADTDGDLDYDLVYQRGDTGALSIWNMDGILRTSTVVPGTPASADWEVRF